MISWIIGVLICLAVFLGLVNFVTAKAIKHNLDIKEMDFENKSVFEETRLKEDFNAQNKQQEQDFEALAEEMQQCKTRLRQLRLLEQEKQIK